MVYYQLMILSGLLGTRILAGFAETSLKSDTIGDFHWDETI